MTARPISLRQAQMDGAPRSRGWLLAAWLACAALLTGCATLTPDAGFAAVAQTARDTLGKDLQWARTDTDLDGIRQRVSGMLARPLSVDDAVQVALLHNRGLQAGFQDLGITEADVVQATRLPNPGFSIGRLTRGDEVELERGLHLNLARLLAWPAHREIGAQRLQQTQARVATQVLTLAADTRKAYYNALAAEETARHQRQVVQAAEAGAELARRMAQVGNFSKLQQAREQVFHADALLNLARAEQLQRVTRERLTRLLGLWGDQTLFTLPERLPALPPAVLDLPDIERVALAQRLDVRAARAVAAQTARQPGLTRTTRFVNVLELGLARFNHSISNSDVLEQLGKVQAHLGVMASGLNASVVAMRFSTLAGGSPAVVTSETTSFIPSPISSSRSNCHFYTFVRDMSSE
jgi:outer membrane protein TolC